MIRSALIFKFYFHDCTKAGNEPKAYIIFATPSVSEKTDKDKMGKLLEQIKKFFIKHDLPYTPRIICNQDFYKEILVKVSEQSKGISDTSELFMRSAQLLNCCEKFKESKKDAKDAGKIA